MEQDIAMKEASLAEAKKAAEAAGGADETLNTAVEAAEKALAEAKALSQDPAKKELDKIKGRKTFTRKERLEFEQRKIQEQLSALEGGEQVDKNAPVTVGMLEEREKENQKKTALDLAESIEDETERELVIHQLENVLTGGNPEERLKVARGYVNSIRNAQIAEELARKREPGKSLAPGAPPRREDVFTPTPEEQDFMQPPYNLSEKDILEARKNAQKKEV